MSSAVFYLIPGADVRQLFDRKDPFEYLVMHEYVYRNMERLGENHPSRETREFGRFLASSRYRLLEEFKPSATFLGISFAGSFSANDYTLVNPGIRIYRYEP
jgi:hypothetical protein